jgi:hypothetical protein
VSTHNKRERFFGMRWIGFNNSRKLKVSEFGVSAIPEYISSANVTVNVATFLHDNES